MRPDTPGLDGSLDVVVQVVREGTETRIALAGELDSHTIEVVRSVFDDECVRRPESLVVDLAAVGFADTHALRLFLEMQRRLKAQGCSLALLHPSEPVRRVLAITGLDERLRIQPAA